MSSFDSPALIGWNKRGDPRGEVVRLSHELTRAIKVRKRAEKESRLQALLAGKLKPFCARADKRYWHEVSAGSAGDFRCGDRQGQKQIGQATKGKNRPVQISQGFLHGRFTPVTQREYTTVMGEKPRPFP